MKPYIQMNKDELLSIKKELECQYKEFQSRNLQLNMARGKPDIHQIELSKDILNTLNSDIDFHQYQDYFNYGLLDGIPEAKEFFSQLLEVNVDNIIVGGNSSLQMMFDQIRRAYTHGYLGEAPWSQQESVKFLCPVPGYDRHFAIIEHFGIEMIAIDMNDDGPNMDLVEKYVQDESVKGIWCVPKYSNPTGISYSDEIVERFAKLKPSAKDFRIFWDNAYLVHHLYDDEQDGISNIMDLCKKYNNEDIVYEFCSTSKITFPGAGVAAMACSLRNKAEILKDMNREMISYDKLNQLRHVLFFKNLHCLKDHMTQHANILRPKFELVIQTFEEEFSHLDIGSWTGPNGGYFITFYSLDNCAKEIVKKCKEAGVILTDAGATYPYGKDPQDSVIRIAPSFPSLEELSLALELFTLTTKLVSVNKILENK